MMSRADLLRVVALHAMPIDRDEFIAAGILKPRGAWYEVKGVRRLPEHVRWQVTERSHTVSVY